LSDDQQLVTPLRHFQSVSLHSWNYNLQHSTNNVLLSLLLLVHGQVTIIFVVSVCLFVCAEFFSAVFDPISIKLGHVICLGLVVSRRI